MKHEEDDPTFNPDEEEEEERVRRLKRRKVSKIINDPENLKKRTIEALNVSLKFTELLLNRMGAAGVALPHEQASESVSQQDNSELRTKSSEAKGKGTIIGGVKVRNWPPKLFEGPALRDYQMEGLRWLMVLDSNGSNGILGDEMGLGKTIQIIAMFSLLIENNVGSEGPFLVIGPLSTLKNWVSEFAKFAPKIPVVLYHGNKAERSMLKNRITKMSNVVDRKSYPVVITSFEMPLHDRSLRNVNWRYVVIDEGHRLKNHRCLLVQELRKYSTVTCVLLTGTPLQNNLTELWSLLNFILPEVVQDKELFESWLDTSTLASSDGSEKLIKAEEKDQVLTTLHKILKPFILRREKIDVGVDIPPKTEVLVYAHLTEFQKALYSFIVDHSLSAMLAQTADDPVMVEKGLSCGQQPSDLSIASVVKSRKRRRSALSSRTYHEYAFRSVSNKENRACIDSSDDENVCTPEEKLLENFKRPHEEFSWELKTSNPVMALRKVCNHPYLVACSVLPGTRIPAIDEMIIERSGKIQLLDALLMRLKRNGHKVLLFSNFIQTLDLVEDYLSLKDYKLVRLDGSRSLADRQINIDKFCDEDEIFIFLISTRAGGLGINLVAADTVIILDSDWNPQMDLQAQDRCHRIGQTRPVVVYRIVVGGTVDEQIVKRAETKKQLEKLVIAGGKFKSLSHQYRVNVEELRDILKIKEDKKVVSESGMVYSEEQLDELCDRAKLFT